MFEKFTDRARAVLILARDEASQLNGFIGTEHLLLGLIREEAGVAGRALSSLHVSLEEARTLVAQIPKHAGRAPQGSPPFTPRAKKVLELSWREALQLGHNYIGTEHLLLGLVREGEGGAAEVLANLGVDLSQVRQRVIQLLSGHVPAEEIRPPARFRIQGQSEARLASCSFCGRQPPESGRLVAGNDAFICEHCVGEWSRRLDSNHPLRWTEHAPSVEELAARVVPTGPPPSDEEAAGQEIVRVFTKMGERTEDGAGLVNVERGENLGPSQEELTRRFPQYVHEGAARLPDAVVFLNASEAVVWMNIPVIGIYEGRAVLVDGQWKVSRDTYCGLVARGGVTCPPPL